MNGQLTQPAPAAAHTACASSVISLMNIAACVRPIVYKTCELLDDAMYFLAGENNPTVVNDGAPEKEHADVFIWCGLGLRWWSIIIGMVHVLMCLVTVLLFVLQENSIIHPSRLITPLTRTIGLWVKDTVPVNSSPLGLGNGMTLRSGCSVVNPWSAAQDSYRVAPIVLSFGYLDTRIIIVVFYALSGLFQIFGALNETSYYGVLKLGCNHISHFVEYSLSASALILGISAQLGMTDFFTLIGVVSNTWCCMIFGLLAEVLHQEELLSTVDGNRTVSVDFLNLHVPYYMVAHLAGWVSMAAAAVTALSNLINFESCIQHNNRDLFWIIGQAAAYFEVAIFVLFGVVQFVSLMAKPGRRSASVSALADRVWWSSVTEFAYILLSLTSKVVLGIMVYTANLI